MFDMINIFEVFLPQLLRYPNPTDPLNGEAAALLMREPKSYEAKVKGASSVVQQDHICKGSPRSWWRRGVKGLSDERTILIWMSCRVRHEIRKQRRSRRGGRRIRWRRWHVIGGKFWRWWRRASWTNGRSLRTSFPFSPTTKILLFRYKHMQDLLRIICYGVRCGAKT